MRDIAATILFALLLSGCALFHHKRHAKEPPKPAPQLIGSIVFVNDSLGFVLVDAASGPPNPGQALKAFRDGQETAVLAVTPEHKRPFITADVVKGSPRQGDEVYQ